MSLQSIQNFSFATSLFNEDTLDNTLSIIQTWSADQKNKEDYNYTKALIKCAITACKDDSQPHHCIVLAYDKRERLRAVAAISEHSTNLYVDSILSRRKQGKKCAQGAGTALMQHIFELAKTKQKARVELHALKSSASFFKKTLKMKASDEPDYFYYETGLFPSSHHLLEV